MTALTVCLVTTLGLALAAVIVLAITLPRRVESIMRADQARGDTRALVVKAALHEASAAEVALIVAPLRALLDEQMQRTLASQENVTAATTGEIERITASLHELLSWLFAFAHAQAAAAPQAAPETTRKPDRPPVSRERSSPCAAPPAIAPPGSAPPLPAGPGLVAAGLGPRPSSRPMPASVPRPLPVSRGGAAPRAATMIGVAPATLRRDTGDRGAWLHGERQPGGDGERTPVGGQPSPKAPRLPPGAGERTALGTAPTMLSMAAVAQPSVRPRPPVDVKTRTGGQGEEGAP